MKPIALRTLPVQCTSLSDSSPDALFRCGHDWGALVGELFDLPATERSARDVLNGTARIARAAHTEIVSHMNPESSPRAKPGDVLISHPTAVREHRISVVPNASHAMSPTPDAALGDGRSEADGMGVDAWLAEDHTHVVTFASHRAPEPLDQRR